MSSPQEGSIPLSVYREHVLRARSSTNHFLVQRDYGWIMSKYEAMFLQDLINRASAPRTKRRTIDGKDCFLCTAKYLDNPQNPFRYYRTDQTKLFSSLMEKGFVQTFKSGMPARRFVFIDLLAIETAVSNVLREKMGDSSVDGNDSQQADGNSSQLVNGNCRRTYKSKEEKRKERTSGLAPRLASASRTTPAPRKRHTQPKETPLLYNANPQSKTGSACTDFDFLIAEQLRHSIAKRPSSLTRSWSRQKWAEDIRSLRSRLSKHSIDGEELIRHAVAWLIAQPDEAKIVRAVRSAGALTARWEWIEDEMRKRPLVTITPEAEDITKKLRNLHWPKGSEKDLLSAVQISLDRYKGFLQRLRDAQKTLDEMAPVKDFLDHFLATHKGVSHFVENWFRDVFTSVVKWDSWSGNILAQALDIHGSKFQKYGTGLATSYSTSKRWTQLMELHDAH